MAEVGLTKQSIVTTGLAPSMQAMATADNYTVANADELVFFYIDNQNAGTATVTIATPFTKDGLALAELTATLATTTQKMMGPFSKAYYNDSDGKLSVTVDVVTVSIAALTLGSP